ncbi:hypothetical protein DMP17_29195 [Pseudonocardia sp. TMWB2A]
MSSRPVVDLRVLRGTPTDDELAALVAVLAALTPVAPCVPRRFAPRSAARSRRRGPGRPARAGRAPSGRRPPLTRSGRPRPRTRAGRSGGRRSG